MTRRIVRDADGYPITPDVVLAAYRHGLFPMADSRAAPIRWYQPRERAIITWDRYVIPKSLSKVARNKQPFTLTINRDFSAVIAACAERSATWISHDVQLLYETLHRMGHAHSVEAWADGQLLGGCYGLAIGGIFCGESMFHRANDAAKLCVMHLVERLQANGFLALDCQQQTPHMERFGAYEIGHEAYAALLQRAAEPRVFP
jgi:leucyl/phenylalanyl-tRNA---protein transferase